jgi:hypothetical protein
MLNKPACSSLSSTLSLVAWSIRARSFLRSGWLGAVSRVADFPSCQFQFIGALTFASSQTLKWGLSLVAWTVDVVLPGVSRGTSWVSILDGKTPVGFFEQRAPKRGRVHGIFVAQILSANGQETPQFFGG